MNTRIIFNKPMHFDLKEPCCILGEILVENLVGIAPITDHESLITNPKSLLSEWAPGGYLLVAEVRANSRKAHSGGSGGEEPEEDGRRRAVRWAGIPPIIQL